MPHGPIPDLLLGKGRGNISVAKISFPDSFDYGVNEHFLKVFVLSYVKFLCDSPLETSDAFKPSSVFHKFFQTLVSTDLRALIKMYSNLADAIIRDEYGTGGTDSTVFVLEMKNTPIFREYHHWYRLRDPKVLKYVLSFLRFGKKLNYVDEDLNAIAFRDWQGVEKRLSELELDEGITASLRNVLAALPPLSDGTLLPKFGSGRVAERGLVTIADKLNMLGRDRKLKFAFERQGPFNKGPDQGFKPLVFFDDTKTCRPVSRLKFVPKDISKSRSICMEPNAYMFLQQEVWRWMKGGINRSLLGQFIHLDDQALSREAALHGSTYLSTDTIDLSSASDSVSVELVRRVFPRDWLFYMMATRTSRVEVPDGSLVDVHKFAPMGSAVCFPTQCLIFTAVCIYASWLTRFGRPAGTIMTRAAAVAEMRYGYHKRRGPDTPFTRRYEPPLVFGDDIAVDSRTTDVVTDLLTKLGFEVNTKKSFRGSQNFREACGIFAFAGEDVTPVTFRLPFIRGGRRIDAKQYAALIENINNMGDHGYHSLATYWLNLLSAILGDGRIPFTENRDRFGVFTTRKKLPPLAVLRWNADLQIGEERVMGIALRKRKATAVNADEYLYVQFWRSRMGGAASPWETKGSSSIRPQETRLVPTWARYE